MFKQLTTINDDTTSFTISFSINEQNFDITITGFDVKFEIELIKDSFDKNEFNISEKFVNNLDLTKFNSYWVYEQKQTIFSNPTSLTSSSLITKTNATKQNNTTISISFTINDIEFVISITGFSEVSSFEDAVLSSSFVKFTGRDNIFKKTNLLSESESYSFSLGYGIDESKYNNWDDIKYTARYMLNYILDLSRPSYSFDISNEFKVIGDYKHISRLVGITLDEIKKEYEFFSDIKDAFAIFEFTPISSNEEKWTNDGLTVYKNLYTMKLILQFIKEDNSVVNIDNIWKTNPTICFTSSTIANPDYTQTGYFLKKGNIVTDSAMTSSNWSTLLSNKIDETNIIYSNFVVENRPWYRKIFEFFRKK